MNLIKRLAKLSGRSESIVNNYLKTYAVVGKGSKYYSKLNQLLEEHPELKKQADSFRSISSGQLSAGDFFCEE